MPGLPRKKSEETDLLGISLAITPGCRIQNQVSELQGTWLAAYPKNPPPLYKFVSTQKPAVMAG
jgi:hypothetical protein